MILKFGDEDIKELRDLTKIVARTKTDTEIDVTIWRDGEEENIDLNVKALEDTEIRRASLNNNGDDLPKLGLVLNEKLEVVDLDPGSAGANAGIRVGDKIETVNNEKVENLDDIRDVLAEAAAEEREAVLLRVKNKRGNRFVAVPIERA